MQLPLTQSWSPDTPLKHKQTQLKLVNLNDGLNLSLHGFDGLGHVGIKVEELFAFLAVACNLGHAGREYSIVNLTRFTGKLDTRYAFGWQRFKDDLVESKAFVASRYRQQRWKCVTYIWLFLLDAEELDGASRIADDHFLEVFVRAWHQSHAFVA